MQYLAGHVNIRLILRGTLLHPKKDYSNTVECKLMVIFKKKKIFLAHNYLHINFETDNLQNFISKGI